VQVTAPNTPEPVDGLVEREADAFLVEWVKAGETWVLAHADEPTAVDHARRVGGTCTPLYRTPTPDLSHRRGE
jgi:hypothetical protein